VYLLLMCLIGGHEFLLPGSTSTTCVTAAEGVSFCWPCADDDIGNARSRSERLQLLSTSMHSCMWERLTWLTSPQSPRVS
jgi:hypothetical protein